MGRRPHGSPRPTCTRRVGATPRWAALLTATAIAWQSPTGGPVLGAAPFHLGYGWNLTFVGGSSLVTGLPAGERAVTQGVIDTTAWIASGVASVASGLLMSDIGFAVLALMVGSGLVPSCVSSTVFLRRAARTAQ